MTEQFMLLKCKEGSVLLAQVWPCVSLRSLDNGSVPFRHNNNNSPENSSVQQETAAYDLKTPCFFFEIDNQAEIFSLTHVMNTLDLALFGKIIE